MYRSVYRPYKNSKMDDSKEQRIMVMGHCADGQFGYVNKEYADSPTSWRLHLNHGETDQVVHFCLGEKHSLALTLKGRVYSCGSNEHGQLGRKSFDLIGECEFRQGLKIIQIATGQSHNLAVTEDGRLFAWGLNDNYQCGISEAGSLFTPTRVSNLSGVCQVACGSLSSIVLLDCNKVFVFGWVIGQAIGPTEIPLLNHIPLRQVAAGGDHFAVLTRSGNVMCWGRNDYGQTSVEAVDEVREPTLVGGPIKSMKVIQVACGGRHTSILTIEGRVFCFGANNFGQLGVSRKCRALSVPSPVLDLLGTKVKSIACGSSHTMAMTSKGLFSFGYNDYGQLGTGERDATALSPVSVKVDDPKALFAGWDQTIILCGGPGWMQNIKLPKVLTYAKMESLIEGKDKIDTISHLEFVFNSLGCLNASFLFPDSPYPCDFTHHGVNMDDVMKTFNLIDESPHAREYAECIISALQHINFKEIYDNLLRIPSDKLTFEVLRIFLILPWFHPMINPSDHTMRNILIPFVELLENVTKIYGQVLRTWWLTFETRHFNRVVSCLVGFIQFFFRRNPTPSPKYLPALRVLDQLCQVNKISNRVPYEKFYLNELMGKVNVHQDYVDYYVSKYPERFPRSQNKQNVLFYWSQYPFLMNAEAKSAILEADSMLKMHLSVASVIPIFNMIPEEHAFLHFHVRRDHIVEDTYEQVMRTSPTDMAKPLRVNFVGEEAEDRGGVRKEYFMLLFQELLQPTYGMFVEDPDSHMAWFSGVDGDPVSYEVVGRLCALAIYNFTLVNLPFPLALYKKLLGQQITLEDFKELHPTEGNSLEKMLEYEGDDFEDVFCQSFVISLEVFEHRVDVPLRPGGADIPVSQQNKNQFVQEYITMKMEKGVDNVLATQLDSFLKGFCRVLDSEILGLFQPRELMEMVTGNENYDWDVLKQNTKYKDEYHARHPVIECFWKVFYDLTVEEKKKFLLFLMGTDRIPLRGMKEVSMVIQPEPEHLIPVAHTCFNLLDLPKITDPKLMKQRLLMALENTSGFSLA
ncbi:unnamed protein product [Bursaphelenchus xylophilus]|uniref:(pine wood nematode) hypothetical protein n=1 Tax=Bursaphelenchus xylophilus TaxID=6326 RepID=A0A1I7S8T7_BURXY|nr:unnamed protein product [Bursaphelenchus xylophilus]CAG9085843.1 unnamed protein product [Bursaphelenchus xylophilus]